MVHTGACTCTRFLGSRFIATCTAVRHSTSRISARDENMCTVHAKQNSSERHGCAVMCACVRTRTLHLKKVNMRVLDIQQYCTKLRSKQLLTFFTMMLLLEVLNFELGPMHCFRGRPEVSCSYTTHRHTRPVGSIDRPCVHMDTPPAFRLLLLSIVVKTLKSSRSSRARRNLL